jgi:hypothetical protein
MLGEMKGGGTKRPAASRPQAKAFSSSAYKVRRASVEQVFTHDSGLNTALVCARSQRPHGSTTWTKTSRFRLRWATYRRFRIWILEAMTPQQPRHRKLAARARPTYVAMG